VLNKYDPGEPLNQDLYIMSDEAIAAAGAQRLPRNLLEATELLRTDELALEVLGDDMMQSFVHYKVDEWERYHQAVTDWEVAEYLRLY
jgi:glutamine synthetase